MIARVGPEGAFCVDDGHEWYRIERYDLLDPFLVTVTTPHDQWIFVSSSGALTAGRRRAEQAVFPYETDDRLHRSGGRTGPVTQIRVHGVEEAWQPFASDTPHGKVRRSIAKTSEGDRLRFEEHHPGLGLTFRYTWSSAREFGLVRTCELLVDEGLPAVDIDLLDGLVDVLPAGVELSTQQRASTLVDAYRRSELDDDSGLALFTLEALIRDKSDPAESLRATTVWSRGLEGGVIALSDRQIRFVRSGEKLQPEHLVTGRKGAFIVSTTAQLDVASPLRWMMVADVEQDHVAVARLRNWLSRSSSPRTEVLAAVDEAHAELIRIVAEADAVQETGDRRVAVHHFANVLFNCMRGGALIADHRVEIADVSRFIASRNRAVHARLAPLTDTLDPVVELETIRRAVAHDADLARLVSEYLPLTFSRRHGDPSRPWNEFNIVVRSEGGEPIIAYEGNWRDIFQNWEALVHSFPGYIQSVVAKFLNASTLDGHNPYRITSDGVDWELPEDGSWSNFGYWGDHQIVYLHRLLDAAHRFHPGALEQTIDSLEFSYADSPYRILPYDRIVSDPKHTLEFDHARQTIIESRVDAIGADGLLVPTDDGRVHHASLAEKLLVPALAKLSNLVPGGGIWLNTQRPEWNDANNALVGSGVSVVTTFHLRGYLDFVDRLLERSPLDEVRLGAPVLKWVRDLEAAFVAHAVLLDTRDAAGAGRNLLDALGVAFSDYRSTVYDSAPEPALPVSVSGLRRFLAVVRPHLDLAIATARGSDGLYDAYRLLRLAPGTLELKPLYAMLEGQVAALSSSDTDLAATVELVDAMYRSDLYRPDQHSFLLYPDRPPPPFLEKNRVPESKIGPALDRLIDGDSGIARRDDEGVVHFGSHIRSAQDLATAMDELDGSVRLDDEERSEILETYEAVFNHRAFTGRSQTMYRYEGLGSIYWHMVTKLLFGLQERLTAAIAGEEHPILVTEMIDRYRRVRAGLGHMKTVAEHGAFPLDPHSHTPAHSGAQQPGMTGAVKEGVLLRWGELGVRVDGGCVQFRPVLLDVEEFLTEPRKWAPLGPGESLEPGTLGFTYCGVPIVYHVTDGEPWTRVSWARGDETTGGDRLDPHVSRALFARSGAIARIDAGVRLWTRDV